MNVMTDANDLAQEFPLPDQVSPWVVVLGRILFTAIFIASSLNHFSQPMIAAAAAQGVPMAEIAVPASGVLELAAGLSVLLGYRARLGAWGLVVFLLPVTLMMHAFWAATAEEAASQLIHFMKNLSLIGAALLVTQFGSGPMSLDSRLKVRNSPAGRA